MKKGFSILAAVLLAAGLCSCGPSPREASPGDAAGAVYIGQVFALRSQPICRAQFMCPV